MNYKLNIPEEYKDAVIVTELNGREERINAADGEHIVNSDDQLFRVYALSKETRDEIHVKAELNGEEIMLKTAGGTEYPDGLTYSIKQAIDWYIENGKPTIVELAKALDTFGKYAQKRWGHNTTGLVYEDVSDITAETLSGYGKVSEGKAEGLTVNTVNVLLESDTKMRLTMSLDEGKEISDYTITVSDAVNGEKVTVTDKNGKYVLEIGNIPSNKIGHAYNIDIAGENGTQHIEYSVLTYAKAVLSTPEFEAINGDLCRAMYKYYLKAVDAFGE
jgi:hypothetical protein